MNFRSNSTFIISNHGIISKWSCEYLSKYICLVLRNEIEVQKDRMVKWRVLWFIPENVDFRPKNDWSRQHKLWYHLILKRRSPTLVWDQLHPGNGFKYKILKNSWNLKSQRIHSNSPRWVQYRDSCSWKV